MVFSFFFEPHQTTKAQLLRWCSNALASSTLTKCYLESILNQTALDFGSMRKTIVVYYSRGRKSETVRISTLRDSDFTPQAGAKKSSAFYAY